MLNKKALAGTPSTPPAYVEDVFSTYLYTGNGSTQTITNGIDLAGKGGLVWTKNRASATYPANVVFDTARGAGKGLITNSTAAEDSSFTQSFSSTGFALGGDNYTNQNGITWASWTFRKAQKFFDIVTYTGNGANRTIAHNLGSVPGMIIVKRTDTTADWQVYHRSLANTEYLVLNTTAIKATGATRWNSTTPTSTEFSLGTDTTVNANTGTYVAYLFAHDAGGFGDAGTDNIISCGSYTGNGSTGQSINVGFEPQFLLIKRASGSTGNWQIFDSMRGGLIASGSATTNMSQLYPNTSGSEANETDAIYVNNTGFEFRAGSTNGTCNGNTNTFIYMAIRRPMKTPTSGTEVFSPLAVTASNGTSRTTNFPVDLQISGIRDGGSSQAQVVVDRLRGVATDAINNPIVGVNLATSSTAAEKSVSADYMSRGWGNTGFQDADFYNGQSVVYWNFRRARGFFDIVCYMGNGNSGYLVKHNLTVVPELAIIKRRDSTGNWVVSSSARQISSNSNVTLNFNATSAEAVGNGASLYASQSTTTQVFINGTSGDVNASGWQYVMYLFASVAGVSKVGSYTGNGSNQTINCGFSAGARFVLIKRTDSTGSWYVFDTNRGIVSGNDPFLLLNSTAAEVTTRDAVDPDNSGFIVNNDATNFPINVNAATYIYLAIA